MHMLGHKSIGCNTVQILQDVNFANEYRFTKNREFSRDYVLNVATGDCLLQQPPREGTIEHIRSRINQSIATDCQMFQPRRPSSTAANSFACSSGRPTWPKHPEISCY